MFHLSTYRRNLQIGLNTISVTNAHIRITNIKYVAFYFFVFSYIYMCF